MPSPAAPSMIWQEELAGRRHEAEPPPVSGRRRGLGAGADYFVTLYVLSPPSFLLDSMLRPIFLVMVPLMNPRMLCALCRCRHKNHYADVRIMPTCVGNPACGAGIAAMESA